ncbi:MAG: NUDIX domain-containing protein [Microcystaceae cyanobacterium]
MGQIGRYIKAFLKVAFRHPVTGVTIIPRLPDGRIVLVRRRDTGQWSLPGGIVDWGQTILQTTERELQEETGLELIKIERLVGVYSSPDRDPRMHSIAILLVVTAAGSLQIMDQEEVLEVQAFTQTELPSENLSHDHEQHLRDFLRGDVTIA